MGCGTPVRRCSVKLLKRAERKITPRIIFVCRNMKHPMGVKNRQDEKKSDWVLTDKEEAFHAGVSAPGLQRDAGDNEQEEKHT